MATQTVAPESNGTALAVADHDQLDRLKKRPIIDTIDARTLALIKAQVAPGCSDGEVGHFLELTAHYGLDPFAREAWCTKSKTGKLLIMVGRDGLRKIAHRNGLHMDCDVVHAKDDFTICRTPDGNRTVAHSYGNPAQRGEIVGAWAEVRAGGPTGKPMGYFYAPLAEYLPKNVSDHSPWSKQVSVMILAAAERQAARQATPLSGLLIEGEDEVVIDNETGQVTGGGEPRGIELPPEVEHVLQIAEDFGHAGLADRGAAEMAVGGQPPEVIAEWVRKATAEIEAMPPEADVVEPDGFAHDPVDLPALEALRAELQEMTDAEALARLEGREGEADDLQSQVEALSAHISAAENADQGSLPV